LAWRKKHDHGKGVRNFSHGNAVAKAGSVNPRLMPGEMSTTLGWASDLATHGLQRTMNSITARAGNAQVFGLLKQITLYVAASLDFLD
jgi:hypothetical protein